MQSAQPVVSFTREYDKADVLPFHSHRRAQLVYAYRGTMTVRTADASYMVPPQRAVWMPGYVEHGIEARSAFSMRSLYFDPEQVSGMPETVRVIQVSPLLRELIAAVVIAGNDYAPDSAVARLFAVIVDQIRVLPAALSLTLPLPSDPRLLRVTQALIDNPADPRDLAQWAREVGASPRTLNRLFPAQTGMTFRDWRQQRRMLRALELLAGGVRVTDVAFELGYESGSAFIAMFRRSLGTTPKRYFGAIP
jgi:AraC-like DNA-binding protein